MRLRYHHAAFELLGEKPVRSASALALIEDWERRHGRSMPESVREWYSLEGADTRLTLPGIEFYQDPLARLLDPAGETESAREWGEFRRRPDLLPCLYVMGVRGEVHFFVRLHGDDDPRMFDDVDPDRSKELFSEFILGVAKEIAEQR